MELTAVAKKHRTLLFFSFCHHVNSLIMLLLCNSLPPSISHESSLYTELPNHTEFNERDEKLHLVKS